jgi:hypothetical protein
MYTMPLGPASSICVINPERQQLERKDLYDPQSPLGATQRAVDNRNATNVDPGMQRKLTLNLRDFYDLSLPGKYVVNVRLRTLAAHSSVVDWVQSSTAVINITE